jgi:hypothetical protein
VIDQTRERFLADTAEHVLAVIRDDGLYKHLRFKQPDTITYYYDLVTWPGYLTITGDCGTFVFSRVEDMLDFFLPEGKEPQVNPRYWSEKLQAPDPQAATRYSEEVLRQHLHEWAQSRSHDLTTSERQRLQEAVNENVLAWAHDEHEAHCRLQEFEHDGLRIHDSWDWLLRDWDFRYLWCCYAIVYGIKQYRETVSAPAPPPSSTVGSWWRRFRKEQRSCAKTTVR